MIKKQKHRRPLLLTQEKRNIDSVNQENTAFSMEEGRENYAVFFLITRNTSSQTQRVQSLTAYVLSSFFFLLLL